MSNYEKIPFYDEHDMEIDFYVLEQTTVSGIDYLLVTDGEGIAEEEASEDAIVYVMKAVIDEDAEGMVTYEFVEDDGELYSVMKIFEQLMDEVDIRKE